jgi:plasmid stabilization system protein ParE
MRMLSQNALKKWEKIVDGAADDQTFDEAERLGQQWRRTAE